MKFKSNKLATIAALATLAAVSGVQAQNANYAPGDLVMYFQKPGSTNTVYARLGSAAADFRGRASRVNFLDIGAQLTAAFGAGWATDTTIYSGLAGVWGTDPFDTTLQNGDPSRTLYVSSPRSGVGTVGQANSTQWVMAGNTQMTSGAAGIFNQNNVLETQYTDAVTVSDTSVSLIDDQNPFLSPGIQGSAFQGAFEGGVQRVQPAGGFGTFGSAGSVNFALDLYRIPARTDLPGQVGGVARQGGFQGTVTLNSSGKVSYIAKTPDYSAGDLVLFFQKPGSSSTVYARLGNAATDFRGPAAGADAADKVNFLNINNALISAFGSGWASDNAIYAGVAGVWGTDPYDNTLQNGDPSRTLYVSSPRNAVGTIGQANSTQWIMAGNTQMTSGASGIYNQNNILTTQYTDGVVVVDTSVSQIDDQNPLNSSPLGTFYQGPAFQGAFEGGVQQANPVSFGEFDLAGKATFALDLYRILATTGVTGQVGGTARQGSYEGTVTVNATGQVSFIPQAPQGPKYSAGDLVMFFQKPGSTNTVYARLGSAATDFRSRTSKVNFLDLSAQLTTAFGSGWANDPTIYSGLAGVWGTDPYDATLQNGDPSRTLYVSSPRVAAGTAGQPNSTQWVMAGNTQMTSGASGIFAQNNVLTTQYQGALAVSDVSISQIDNQNPLSSTLQGLFQGAAFQGAFEGGVQQVNPVSFGTVGSAGSVTFALDLYRILARTDIAGQVVDGVARQGAFQGTITLNSSGKVSYIAKTPDYTAGDLVLYFQKPGSPNTVYARLGNPVTAFRGQLSKINFLNINNALISAFGSGWAGDSAIYAGVAGVWGTDPYDNTLQNGDPSRTLYVSSPRNAVGNVGQVNSTQWIMAGNTQMTSGAAGIFNQNNVLATQYTNSVVVSDVSVATIDDQNPFLSPGIQAAAFQGAFEGGVQQANPVSFGTFGSAGSVSLALDVYRILATTSVGGQTSGPLRQGAFQGTVTVGTNGMVSFVTPSYAYDTWLSAYPAISASADKLTTANPGHDGLSNLFKFAFAGNPAAPSPSCKGTLSTVDVNSDGQRDFTLTVQVRGGATFAQAGGVLTATADNLTYQILGSTDLVNWTSLVSEVTPSLGSGLPASGYVFKTFRLNAGNGLSGKGFLRAAVTKGW